MIVSDACPIQFWDIEDETFNEKEVCSITQVCWCQPMTTTDSFPIQFYDEGVSPDDFFLAVFDSDDILFSLTAFTDSSGVQSADLEIGTPGIYRVVIAAATAADFIDDADTWTQHPTFQYTSRTASTFVKVAPVGTSAAYAQQAVAIPAGVTFSFKITVTITGTWVGSISVVIPPITTRLAPATTTVDFNANVSAQEIECIFLTAALTSAVEVGVEYVINSGEATITLAIENGDPLYLSAGDAVKKSDCIDVRASHDCTTLVTYSNGSDYAGLRYTGIGTPEFNVRVPVVFFHDQFTEEEEDHELSDNTIIEIYSKIQHKRRFDVAFVPYYFHKKLQLIMAHQYLEIDGEQWIKRKGDTYEVEEGNRRYPLKKAGVWLTDKDYIKRNLL